MNSRMLLAGALAVVLVAPGCATVGPNEGVVSRSLVVVLQAPADDPVLSANLNPSGQPHVALRGPTGSAIPGNGPTDNRYWWDDVRTGKYQLTVSDPCRTEIKRDVVIDDDHPSPPELAVHGTSDSSTFELPVQLPAATGGPQYVTEKVRARVPSKGEDLFVPPGAKLQVLRPWGEGCKLAAAKVLDAGDWYSPGTLVFIDQQYLAPTPKQSLADFLAQEKVAQEKQAAEEAEKARAVVLEELKSGRCAQGHYDHFQKIATVVDHYLSEPDPFGSGVNFNLAQQKFLVASQKGTSLTLSSGAGGTLHVFAFITGKGGSLEVLDGQGYKSDQQSPVLNAVPVVLAAEQLAGNEVQTREVRANAGEKLRINVKGPGCALLMVYDSF